MPNCWMSMIALLLVPIFGIPRQARKTFAREQRSERTRDDHGNEFQVPDIDNVPNLHGNPANCADRTLAS